MVNSVSRKIVVVEEADYGGGLYGRFRERLPEFVKETRGRMATCLFSKKDDINRSANERKLKDAQTLSSKRKGIHLRYQQGSRLHTKRPVAHACLQWKSNRTKKVLLQNPHNIFSLKYQGQVCNWNLHLKLLTNTETFCYTLLEQSLYRTEMQNFFQLLSRCLHGNCLCRHSLTSRVIWRDGPGHQDFVSLARSQSKCKNRRFTS